ncbi:MAG: hypothetical protein MI700_10885 [Balneolales bacterium]|nr:hypothetical protein [Balneolales bacterium]
MESYIIGIGQKMRVTHKEKELYASESARRAKVADASDSFRSSVEN